MPARIPKYLGKEISRDCSLYIYIITLHREYRLRLRAVRLTALRMLRAERVHTSIDGFQQVTRTLELNDENQDCENVAFEPFLQTSSFGGSGKLEVGRRMLQVLSLGHNTAYISRPAIPLLIEHNEMG